MQRVLGDLLAPPADNADNVSDSFTLAPVARGCIARSKTISMCTTAMLDRLKVNAPGKEWARAARIDSYEKQVSYRIAPFVFDHGMDRSKLCKQLLLHGHQRRRR